MLIFGISTAIRKLFVGRRFHPTDSLLLHYKHSLFTSMHFFWILLRKASFIPVCVVPNFHRLPIRNFTGKRSFTCLKIFSVKWRMKQAEPWQKQKIQLGSLTFPSQSQVKKHNDNERWDGDNDKYTLFIPPLHFTSLMFLTETRNCNRAYL